VKLRASETLDGSLKKACIPRVKRVRNHRTFVLGTSGIFGFWKSHATVLLSTVSLKFPYANPLTRMNHHLPICCDRPDLLCVRPHNKHCVWPRGHLHLHNNSVFVFCWTVGVFQFLPTQKQAGLRGELCALLVHRWVHKQPVLF